MSDTPERTVEEIAKHIVSFHREVSPTCALIMTEKAVAKALAEERKKREEAEKALEEYRSEVEDREAFVKKHTETLRLEREVSDGLAVALRKNGVHENSCQQTFPDNLHKPCTCYYDKILARHAELRGKR
jgi:hypothetical protein